jgi:hypothetical protein
LKIVDLPPPEAPTKAVTELDPPARDLEFLGAAASRRADRQVEEFEQDAHAGQPVLQFEIEPGEALGRLVGENERRDERGKPAWRAAEHEHIVAADQQHPRDRNSAEGLHQRRSAIGDARQLVGGALDFIDMRVDLRAHDVLEIECLDDLESLHRLLERLENEHVAAELRKRDAAYPLDQLAQKQHRGRKNDERGERQQRRPIDHDRAERDESEEIAAYRGDEEIEDRGGGISTIADARAELRRMLVGEERHVLLQQLVEHAPLIGGDDQVADPRERHRLAVGGEALNGEDHDREGGDDDDAVETAADIGLIDRRPDQIRGRAGAGCSKRHEEEGERVSFPIGAAVIGDEARDEADRARRIGKPFTPRVS